MIRSLKKKLKSNNGESLIETLVTVLIVVLMMEMVAGAVISAAKVNDKADNTATTFSVKDAELYDKTVTITFKSSNVGKSTGNGADFSVTTSTLMSDQIGVKLYKSGDYYFYEAKGADE